MKEFLVKLRIGSGHTGTVVAPVRDAMVFYLFLSAIYSKFAWLPFRAFILTAMLIAGVSYVALCLLMYRYSWQTEADILIRRMITAFREEGIVPSPPASPLGEGKRELVNAKEARSLVRDVGAVSPVIAVILMVAITVVLAATVFVLVSDINPGNQPSPAVSYTVDDTADRISVQTAGPKADWARLEIGSDVATLKFRFNADASNAAGTAIPTGTYVRVTSTSAQMKAGDFLDFCSTSGTPDAKITLRDSTANAIVGEFKLNQVVACA